MKTAIYSLYQKKEFNRAKFFVGQCLPQLNENRQLLVQVNDDGIDEFSSFCKSASQYIHILGGDGNLGVAGGRNALIRYGIAQGFDFFISCDNDIIYEKDYFSKIETGYMRIKKDDPDIGLVQPVLFDGRQIKSQLGIINIDSWDSFGNGLQLREDLLSDTWNRLVVACGLDKAKACIYHAGMSNIFAAHFHGPLPARLSDLPWDASEHRKKYHTDKHSLLQVRGQLIELLSVGNAARVYTVAGGITAFHKDVIARCGEYNEKFNPFGYEDSEYGFRVTQKGLNNYLLSNTWAIHDPFMGASNRELLSHATIARLRAIEISALPEGSALKAFTLAQSLFFCWYEHNIQFDKALASGSITRDLAEPAKYRFIASYIVNFLYGMFGAAAPAKSFAKQHLFERILPTGFSEYHAQDVELDFGRSCSFRASSLDVAVRTNGNDRRILSVASKNCRLEEAVANAPNLTSLYFDAYLVLAEVAQHKFALTINLQADADTFAVKIDVDMAAAMNSMFKEPPEIRVTETKHNTYTVGGFSTEDIYPKATFGNSTNWLPELKRAAALIRESGEGAISWLVDAFVWYCDINENINDTGRNNPLAASRTIQSSVAVGVASTGNNVQIPHDSNRLFSDANVLYRNLKYSEALSKYVFLANSESRFHLYKQSAVNCYMKALEYNQACAVADVAYVRGLVAGVEVTSQ